VWGKVEHHPEEFLCSNPCGPCELARAALDRMEDLNYRKLPSGCWVERIRSENLMSSARKKLVAIWEENQKTGRKKPLLVDMCLEYFKDMGCY
jgi:hypothetical protein